MPKFYGTFMQKQAFSQKYVEIHAPNYNVANSAMHDHFGENFMTVYSEANFAGQKSEYDLNLLCVINAEPCEHDYGGTQYSDGWNAEKEIQLWKNKCGT